MENILIKKLTIIKPIISIFKTQLLISWFKNKIKFKGQYYTQYVLFCVALYVNVYKSILGNGSSIGKYVLRFYPKEFLSLVNSKIAGSAKNMEFKERYYKLYEKGNIYFLKYILNNAKYPILLSFLFNIRKKNLLKNTCTTVLSVSTFSLFPYFVYILIKHVKLNELTPRTFAMLNVLFGSIGYFIETKKQKVNLTWTMVVGMLS